MNYRLLLSFLLLALFSTPHVEALELLYNSTGSISGIENPKTEVKRKKRVIETGNDVVVDGSVRVLEQIYGKQYDLIESTQPVTPASNHLRLYAVQIGTYTQLRVIFDDGTSKVISNN